MENYIEDAFEKLHNIEDNYLINNLSMIPITEANLNRVVNGHNEKGYVILSACRQDLWKKGEEVVGKEPKDLTGWRLIKKNSLEHINENDKRTKALRELLKENKFSYISVYGGFKEEGQDKANIEKSFIVFPFFFPTKTETDFDTFIKKMFEFGKKYNQDAILVKYPNKNPRYFDPETETFADDYEFTGTSLNDITREYFTALKKWSDMSKKTDFSKGKPQRWTFECYMNDFPQTIAEHRIRSNAGELVRFEVDNE